MGAAVSASVGSADTILLGRKTYDSFAGAWPERETAGVLNCVDAPAASAGTGTYDDAKKHIQQPDR